MPCHSFLLSRALLCLLAISGLAGAIPTISVTGSKFFDSNGNQFFIKGVAYPTPNLLIDPLLDAQQCTIDANLMKTLGANAIRVYYVDNTQDHDACMTAFANAGIYVLLDLDTFPTEIIGSSPNWNITKFNAYTKTLDAFQKYDNLLAVFAGNQVIADSTETGAAIYIKAAARDIKAYRDGQGYRDIPVGYDSADLFSLDINTDTHDYLACGGIASNTVDFLGVQYINAYCDQFSFPNSGYEQFYVSSLGYDIPIFFSVSGCNGMPRLFLDQVSILGSDMNSVWSGSFVYHWAQEQDGYGIVAYGDPVTTESSVSWMSTGTPTPISSNFNNLQSQWATLSPSGTAKSDYTPANTPPACPQSSSSVWAVDPSAPLPVIDGLVITTRTKTSASASGTSAAAATGSDSATSPPSSLSTGAKVAIGVVVPLGVIAIVIISILLLRRHRKRRSPPINESGFGFNPQVEAAGVPVSQLDAAGTEVKSFRPELDGRDNPVELGNMEEEPMELDGTPRVPA